MTYCLGIRLEEGLVGLADTRITSGTETTTARKITVYERDGGMAFLMTSGLRSIRDKVLTYFQDQFHSHEAPFTHLFQVANLLSEQVRLVGREDRQALAESGLHFDMHCIVGGKMPGDDSHRLFMVYPQGNWVEVGEGTPYQIIGQTGYGKPILDRTLHYGDSLRFGVKVGFLSFDSTRISASNVDFPVDVIVYRAASHTWTLHRFQRNELESLSEQWQAALRESVQRFPGEWVDVAFADLGQ